MGVYENCCIWIMKNVNAEYLNNKVKLKNVCMCISLLLAPY